MSYIHANYLVVPCATSESWEYLPICFTNKIDAGHYWSILPESHLYQFGILNSSMHMTWIKCISGKLQGYQRMRQNPTVKNFPWPINHTQAHIVEIENKALAVLQIRAQYPAFSLAELYHPATMPQELRKAHDALDEAVDAAYGYNQTGSGMARIDFLLGFQRKLAWLLMSLNEEVLPEAINAYGITDRHMASNATAGALF